MRKELCLAEGIWSINRLPEQTAAIQSRRDTRFEALALRMLGTNTVNRFDGEDLPGRFAGIDQRSV
jgi:hypothetical protein